MKYFQGRSCPKQDKKQPSIGIKSFYSNASYGFEYKKNCISKVSIKMFIKRKVWAGNVYANRMLLNYKTSVTYKNIFDFTPDNCVRCEAAFVGHNSIFCRTLFDVRC